MRLKPRTRLHQRAAQALKRFHLARTVEAKLYRGGVTSRYLGELLVENSELRDQLVAFGAEIDRLHDERRVLRKLLDGWFRGAR